MAETNRIYSYSGWSTAYECNFIDQIGTFQDVKKPDVRELLEKYIAAALVRDNWGDMDKTRIIARAYYRLTVEERIAINGGSAKTAVKG